MSYVDIDERGSSANWNDQSEMATPFPSRQRTLGVADEHSLPAGAPGYHHSEQKPDLAGLNEEKQSRVARSPKGRFSHISEEAPSKDHGSALNTKLSKALF